MALPSVVELSDRSADKIAEIGERVREASERATIDVGDSVKSYSDGLADKISNPLDNMGGLLTLGALTDFGSLFTFGAITAAMNKGFGGIADLFKKKDKFENTNNILSLQVKLMDESNAILEDIYSYLKVMNSEEQGIEDDAEFNKEKDAAALEDLPLSEDEDGFITKALKFPMDLLDGVWILFTGAIKNILKGLAIAASGLLAGGLVAGLAAAAVGAFNKTLSDIDIGNVIGEAMGASDGVAGAVAAFVGLEGDLLSSLAVMGKYAIAGMAFGALGGPIGIMTGALLGAAIGAIITALTNFIGFENIVNAVQGILDYGNTMIEAVLGTDVERVKGRINDLEKGRATERGRIEEFNNKISEINGLLADAIMKGNKDDIAILQKRLEKTIVNRDASTARLAEITANIESKETELANAHDGWLGTIEGWWDATLAFPENAMNYMTELKDAFVSGAFELLRNSVASIKEWIMDKLKIATDVGTMAKDKVDSIVTTITDFYGEIFDTVMETITNLVGTIKEGMLNLVPDFISDKVKGLFDFFKPTADVVMKDNPKLKEASDLKFVKDNIDEKSNVVKESLKNIETSLTNTTQSNLNNIANVNNSQNISTRNVYIDKKISDTRNPDSTISVLESGAWGPAF